MYIKGFVNYRAGPLCKALLTFSLLKIRRQATLAVHRRRWKYCPFPRQLLLSTAQKSQLKQIFSSVLCLLVSRTAISQGHCYLQAGPR